jgi:hemolysin D
MPAAQLVWLGGIDLGGEKVFLRDQVLQVRNVVSLDHEQMQVDDRLVNLSPGMAVTVEIRTGTRRIISYLLSPLARYTHDSLRER